MHSIYNFMQNMINESVNKRCTNFHKELNRTQMFTCMPSRKRSDINTMQVQIHVNQPFYKGTTGNIRCIPSHNTCYPVVVQWYDTSGTRLANDSLEYKDVHCGQYKVKIKDANDEHFETSIKISPVDWKAVVVTEYIITHASTPHARDGEVEVRGFGLEARKIFWNIGITTDEPKLKDVPQGTYFAIGVIDGDETNAVNVHLCQPATVGFE